MDILLLTLGFMAFAMLIMAVGVIFRRPCLRGSCGGPEVLGPDGQPLSCEACPRRHKARRRVEEADRATLPVVR